MPFTYNLLSIFRVPTNRQISTWTSRSSEFSWKLSDSSLSSTKPFPGINQVELQQILLIFPRIDTGNDNRISREEFTSGTIRDSIETVTIWLLWLQFSFSFQWVGPIQDFDNEFSRIDTNGGGQILFSEFVDWALEKDLDIEDDIDED